MANTLQDHHISFTEDSNAIDNLEKAYFFIALARRAPINWKWAILALCNALYGFAICALHGAGRDTVYTKNQKLITLDEALHKCKDPKLMGSFEGSQPLRVTESQSESIKKMKRELRDNFEHFTPKTWSIEIEDLPHMALDVLDVISFLAIDTETNIHVLKKAEEIKKLINDCRVILEKQSHSATPCPAARHQ